MLTDISRIDHIYIACGHTDLRYGIDGLAAKIRISFGMDPFSNSLFLFCVERNDRIKGLLKQPASNCLKLSTRCPKAVYSRDFMW